MCSGVGGGVECLNGSFSPLRGQHCRIYGTTHLFLYLKKKRYIKKKEKGERGLFSLGGLLGRVATRRSVAVKTVPASGPEVHRVSCLRYHFGSDRARALHAKISKHRRERDSDERIDNEQSASATFDSSAIADIGLRPMKVFNYLNCVCVSVPNDF